MKKFAIKTRHQKMLADVITPVSLYLKLRDRYENCVVLESSDYHHNEDSYSYIACNPIAAFELHTNGRLERRYPDGTHEVVTLDKQQDAVEALSEFASAFETEPNDFKFISNGLFGYLSFDAVEAFEDIKFDNPSSADEIPAIVYRVYEYIIAIDHFKNELYLLQHGLDEAALGNGIEDMISLIHNKNFPSYGFEMLGEENTNFTDEEFLEVINKGIEHCHRGDVFQIVLSRRFWQNFKGDEFNVYRSLRNINPSPYLFYFDYGSFKIFGSSPEAQIVIKERQATIFPIAGTFRRTGNDEKDAELARKLLEDPKENSEHVMLVDLARNDLSRSGDNVTVDTFKEVQYFSHVIHLVSKVTGRLHEGVSPFRMVADTFPAGTLSGAPKHMAMTLIDRYENRRRGYYGGAIGFMGFNGDFNGAIMIRSFLSQNNTLHYQAGAGVVAKSVDSSELQEVHNKLAALRQALKEAQQVGSLSRL